MNSRYELVIYWSQDDDCFVVEVPELPGCMSDGKSYQEAVSNAEEVIAVQLIHLVYRNNVRVL